MRAVRHRLIAATLPAGGAFALAVGAVALAQPVAFDDPARAGDARRQAEQALARAQQRAAALERAAQAATAAADRTATQAALVAARIQQSEAEIALAQARIARIAQERAALRRALGARQEPVVRLTAALQLMARRPLVFGLMRSDRLRDTVYLRAVLETMLPEVRRRTAGLRSAIAQARALQDRARTAAAELASSRQGLARQRQELVALESRQRIASRAAQGSASREADRVLALAEQARDLGALMDRLRQDGTLRAQLAALPGPVPRPERPGEAPLAEPQGPLALPAGEAFAWILPVTGRITTGFGEGGPAGAAHGVTFAAAAGAQVVAPAAGRVAFAGPYRGYGRIVIIEHPGGWTSLVTGLGTLATAVGTVVVQGAPLGEAGPGLAGVTVELRRDGVPVNPLDYLKT